MQDINMTGGSGTATPENNGALAGGAAQGFMGQAHAVSVDCAAATAPPPRASRSTATEAQRARILTMLRNGEKTTFDFRRAGVMQSSTRIFELRARGYSIPTVARRDMFDADGYRHTRVAVYALVGEPEGGVA